MRMIAHGIDLVDCPRIEKMLQRHGRRFLERVFTDREQAYARSHRNCTERLAGRFAAKEAILKLIGTGWRGGIGWTDIEVINDEAGRPVVVLSGQVKSKADELGIDRISISITHTADLAIASAVAITG